MNIVISLTLFLLLPLGIVATLHYGIGRYPEPHPPSSRPRMRLAEVGMLWTLALVTSTAFLLQRSPDELASPDIGVQLEFTLWMFVPWLLIPTLYAVFRLGWRRRELGFVAPRSWAVTLFALALFGFVGSVGITQLDSEPLPWSLLAVALYQPAFIEEFLFRVILQGSLERVIGQTQAWIAGGVLFGLIHVPVDFFGPQFYAYGQDFLASTMLLVSQIIAGCIFGIIYAKTRSIFPGMVAHYLTDFRLGSVILHLTA